MKTLKQFLGEEVPVNSASGGQVAGIGVGAQGEPPKKSVMKKMLKRKNPLT